MVLLETVSRLQRAGQYHDALRELESLKIPGAKRLSADLIKAELLEAIGRLGEARSLATRLLKQGPPLPPSGQSSCEYVLGRISREQAHTDEAIDHLQRSIAIARQAHDVNGMCRAQLLLMVIVSDRSGSDAAAPLVAETRANVTALGDPHMSASWHVWIGEMEAKQGLLKSAIDHALIAWNLLQSRPNYWLEAIVQNLLLAIAILRCDYARGISHGQQALALAQRSGHASMCRAILGNLGNVFYLHGDFDRAIEHFERALRTLPSDSEKSNASL